jgi:hypothetical protein
MDHQDVSGGERRRGQIRSAMQGATPKHVVRDTGTDAEKAVVDRRDIYFEGR